MRRILNAFDGKLAVLIASALLLTFLANSAEAQTAQGSLCDRFPSFARRLPACNTIPPPPPADACPNVPGNQSSVPCADQQCIDQGSTWDGTSCVMPPPPPAQCSDGTDNDSDGKVDFPADGSCSNADDNNETGSGGSSGGGGGGGAGGGGGGASSGSGSQPSN